MHKHKRRSERRNRRRGPRKNNYKSSTNKPDNNGNYKNTKRITNNKSDLPSIEKSHNRKSIIITICIVVLVIFAVSGIFSYGSARQVEISTITLDIVEDTCNFEVNLRGGAADSDDLRGGDLTLEYGNEKVPLTMSGKTLSSTFNTTVLTSIMSQSLLQIRGTINAKILFGLIPVSTDISHTIDPEDQGLDIENIKSTLTMSDRKTSWTDSGAIRVEMKLAADMPDNLDIRIKSAPGKIETQTSTYPCTIKILELNNDGTGHVKMTMSQGTAFSLMFAESITGFSFLDT